MNLFKRLNWHVLMVGAGGLFVSGSPLAAVFAAFGVPNDIQDNIFKIAGSIILLSGTVVVIIKAALTVTDNGKAKFLSSVDPTGWSKILANMSDDHVIQMKDAIDKRVINGNTEAQPSEITMRSKSVPSLGQGQMPQGEGNQAPKKESA